MVSRSESSRGVLVSFSTAEAWTRNGISNESTNVLDTTTSYGSTLEYSTSLVERSTWEIGICATFLALVITVAFVGNISVILAILTSRQLKEQQSNVFVINLSIVDLCTTVIVMLTTLVALVRDDKQLDRTWCNFVCAANYCLVIVSMLTLGNISAERYIAVTHPLKYQNMITRSKIVVAITYSWLQGLIFALVPVGMDWISYDYWEVICAIGWQKEKQKAVYYVIIAFIMNFVIPGMMMLFCYVQVMKVAKKAKSTIPIAQANVNDPIKKAAKQEQRRAIKTITSLLIVVAGFFLFQAPFCVTKLLKVIVADQNFVPAYINLFASYMQYLASMVNPFIYGIFRADFRRAYVNLLHKYCGFLPCVLESEQNLDVSVSLECTRKVGCVDASPSTRSTVAKSKP